MSVILRVAEKAREHFENSRGSHDLEHTLRVRNLCLHIGKIEGADCEILELAALLHDVGRATQDASGGKVCHALVGGKMARAILEGFGYPADKAAMVVHCVETHRFRGDNPPESKEAKILFDADKLDSIGAVGIGRAFLFAGEIGAKLHDKDVDVSATEAYTKDDTAYREYLVKLKSVKDKMLTAEGKRLAAERHDFMAEFFARLNAETEGEL